MQVLAQVNMMVETDGTPRVQLQALPDFHGLSLMDKAVLLHASVQLCANAVHDLITSNPVDADGIREHLSQMSIMLDARAAN